MGLYFVYTPDIKSRKTKHLFSFDDAHCLLNGKAVFDYKDSLDIYKEINICSSSKKIDSYEIVVLSSHTLDVILPYLSEYLSDKDITIGLITDNKEYADCNESILNEYGVTYSRHVKVKRKPSRPKPRFDVSYETFSFKLCSVAAPAPVRKNKTIKLDESFHDKFMKLLIESGKDNVEVYKASGITRQVFSKIISDKDMIPTKLTLMSLCIGLELPLFVAKELMESAGYSLSRSLLLDSIVMKYLRDEKYDFTLINSELNENGCQLLGWRPRDN